MADIVRKYDACGPNAVLFEPIAPPPPPPPPEPTPEQQLLRDYPELEPVPGVRVSWWARCKARLYRWVHS